ncbi:hypothetical protein P7L70_02955 (plasmid) [Tistrella mobilis]|uniref:hypothetical protein n=1 Tax=Tistrella mobilis TaxID=171437 RepID=UPI0035581073
MITEPETTQPGAARIAALIGAEATDLLIGSYGGTRRYIPSAGRLTGGHWLSALIGPEAAIRFCDAFGPGHLTLPRHPTTRTDRRRLIGIAAGPAHAVARRFGVTERWVYACRAAARAARRARA